MRFVAAAIAVVCLIGCSSSRQSTAPKPQATAPLDPWVITNLDPNVDTPALLWNGLIGLQINPGGFGAGNTMFDITSYQADAEEKIMGLPNPLAGSWSVNNETLRPSADYKAVLNVRHGVIIISWTQMVRTEKVTYRTLVHLDPHQRIVRQMWQILGPDNVPVSFHQEDLKIGATKSVRADQYAVFPLELQNLHGEFRFLATEWDPKQFTHEVDRITWSSRVWKGQVYAERILSLAPKGHPLPKLKAEVNQKLNRWLIHGPQPTVPDTESDIEIDGPVEDQQFIRSALFYLRNSIHPQGRMSVSPMGLSSDIYNGHVFWDADIWVFPALALIDPERAKAIPDYRLKHLAQADRNYQEWLKAGRPTGKGNMGSEDYSTSKWYTAAKFPWESSITGNETVPGPSRYQDHITGSVVWSTQQASSLGLISDVKAKELLAMAAGFYGQRSHKVGNLREIHNTMSPDEHHTGDNDLYTNLLAMWVTNGGKWPDKPTYKLPADEKSFLTYDNDGLRGYKQAAAVLSIYPLQYPPAEKQARQMMERFADKVTKNGPAMTDSIHSIIWARLGEKDKAYKAWHDSWKPFVKPPFLLFSEKRNSSRTYFTTGAAGSLQAVLYGFAGIRIDSKKAPNAQWSIPLKNGQILSIAPNLPKEWKKLTLSNLTILGKNHTFEIEGDKVKVTIKE